MRRIIKKAPSLSYQRPKLGSVGPFNEIYDAAQRYELEENVVFVFGSNFAGIHGAGAAKVARFEYGAKLGHGDGLTGRAYGIPTKDEYLNVLPIEVIKFYVDKFVKHTQHADCSFFVTAVGCGLAGYKPFQIAPLFRGAVNCWFPSSWLPYILI